MAAGGSDHEKNEEKNFQKSYFDVVGICCPSEVPLIENILKRLDGVKDVKVTVPTKTVVVYHDSLLISQLQIVKALNKASLEASVKVEGELGAHKKWLSPYAIASGTCLLLSFLKYVFHPLHWLALGAVAFGIIPITLRAATALRNFTFGDIHILVLIAVVGSIALKDYWEAGTIVFLFAIADWLESLASHKATVAMSSLLNSVPQIAILAETGQEVDVREVKINTIIAVKDGEIIPIDGVVVEGNCEVDEKTLTGESFPVTKQKDSTVWAATINVNGYISVRTTALAEDCVVTRMTKLVEEAQHNKSKTERYMEKFAKYYTPGIVLISAVLAIVPTILRVHNQKKWYRIALVVLVSACPCALILSTPVAMFCALTKAAKLGVFFKGADYLETLGRVKVMAFDKTGTITRAEFEVTEFRSLADYVSLNTLLYWVSSIESKSSHPMAAALIDLAQSHSVEPKPEVVEQFQNFPGEGIYGKIDGKEIHIGNSKISSRAGCQSVPKLEGNLDQGKSVGYVFLGSTPAGIFCLADVCRTGAKEALKELKSMGIKSIMITGDCYAAAKHAQDQLGGALEIVHADLLPHDKARIVKDFQKQACTAMIGDGINDAPALATADVGISMGISGSPLATETGHVILMTNDIQRIPKVANLARKVRRKILENIILSIATKVSILALAIAGHPIVWGAVLSDVGTCLLVILNSMLLLRVTPRYGVKCCKSSAALPDKKREGKCSGSVLLHSHQPCCQDMKSRKHCEAKTCFSNHCNPVPRQQNSPLSSISSSCCSGQSSESTNKHSCCHDIQIPKKKCADSGCCKSVILMGGSNTHHHAKIDCSDSTTKLADYSLVGREHNKKCRRSDLSYSNQSCCHDRKPQNDCEVQLQSCCSKISDSNRKHNCGQSNQVGKAKCSDHGNCKSDFGHKGSTKHHRIETGCCNSTKRLGGDSAVHEILKHCHHEKHHITSSNDSSPSSSDPGAKNHVAECEPPNHSVAYILEGHNDVHCSTIMTCKSLEKRHSGGCCESFRKECCVDSGHFGTSLRGGLPEIVIE